MSRIARVRSATSQQRSSPIALHEQEDRDQQHDAGPDREHDRAAVVAARQVHERSVAIHAKHLLQTPHLDGATRGAAARLGSMAAKRSAGILLFRRAGDAVEVLLGHMGGPLWERRDAGAWTIPKGEYEPDEPPQDAARREFGEELGLPVPPVELIELGSVTQSGGKLVTAWA